MSIKNSRILLLDFMKTAFPDNSVLHPWMPDFSHQIYLWGYWEHHLSTQRDILEKEKKKFLNEEEKVSLRKHCRDGILGGGDGAGAGGRRGEERDVIHVRGVKVQNNTTFYLGGHSDDSESWEQVGTGTSLKTHELAANFLLVSRVGMLYLPIGTEQIHLQISYPTHTRRLAPFMDVI